MWTNWKHVGSTYSSHSHTVQDLVVSVVLVRGATSALMHGSLQFPELSVLIDRKFKHTGDSAKGLQLVCKVCRCAHTCMQTNTHMHMYPHAQTHTCMHACVHLVISTEPRPAENTKSCTVPCLFCTASHQTASRQPREITATWTQWEVCPPNEIVCTCTDK